MVAQPKISLHFVHQFTMQPFNQVSCFFHVMLPWHSKCIGALLIALAALLSTSVADDQTSVSATEQESSDALPKCAGIARTSTGLGYWIAMADGKVIGRGDAIFYGSLAAAALNAPVIGIVAKPADDGGYWLVAADGGVFSFGDVSFRGSLGDKVLARPVVGMACTSDGKGYWLATSGGKVVAFDAPFHDSFGDNTFADVVAIAGARHSDGEDGYWLLRSNGEVFSFHAENCEPKNTGEKMTAFCATSKGDGLWLLSKSGKVFPCGAAKDFGGGEGSGFVGIARGSSDRGYWLLRQDGKVFARGDAKNFGGAE